MIGKSFDGRTLIVVLQDGLNAYGEPKYIRKSVRYFSEILTADQLHSIGLKLASFYNLPFGKLYVDEDYELVTQ